MNRLLAEFPNVETIVAGANVAREQGFPARDALTPYPVPALDALLPPTAATIRIPMAVAGFGVALFAFAFQWWSAAYAYPFNSGGRPLFSWPVFLLVPFEVGMLAAAIAGMIAFFVHCGLPRLHHPVFEVAAVGRATQDRFFLLLDHPGDDAFAKLRSVLLEAGASSLSECGA